ncbi:MAG: hypothetical protein AB1705_23745, partial [Verrucomicrobiota bacterium]
MALNLPAPDLLSPSVQEQIQIDPAFQIASNALAYDRAESTDLFSDVESDFLVPAEEINSEVLNDPEDSTGADSGEGELNSDDASVNETVAPDAGVGGEDSDADEVGGSSAESAVVETFDGVSGDASVTDIAEESVSVSEGIETIVEQLTEGLLSAQGPPDNALASVSGTLDGVDASTDGSSPSASSDSSSIVLSSTAAALAVESTEQINLGTGSYS